MKRVSKILVLVVITMFSSCSDQGILSEKEEKQQDLVPLSGREINAYIKKSLEETGKFEWNDADDYVLWSAVMLGDGVLTIGFGKESFALQKSTQRENIKQELLALATSFEEANSSKLKNGESLLVDEEEVINCFDIKIANIETIEALRGNSNVRYLDPSGYRYMDYEMRLKSSSGCDKASVAVYSSDYTTISPNCLVSWTFYKHNIPSAWSYSTGSGITVGLIDTGVANDQYLLGSWFNDGYSSGRYIQKYGVFVDSFWPWKTNTDGYHDKCGHGTRMAGTIASPRNNNYMPVGVAYNSNLVSYRATGDVVLDGYHEQKGVARALTEMGNRSDVKVISMSIGHIISIGRIKDAVKYAYNRGKLIIAAGGTSTTWTNFVGVIFPASMAETVAATGITDGSGYTECSDCHKGSAIDFTVVMERYWDSSRKSVGIGYYNNSKTYVGGSSVSTATTAGIAALIWSKYPGWSRSQVLQRMKESASLYPNKSNDYGYGIINALAAVQ